MRPRPTCPAGADAADAPTASDLAGAAAGDAAEDPVPAETPPDPSVAPSGGDG